MSDQDWLMEKAWDFIENLLENTDWMPALSKKETEETMRILADEIRAVRGESLEEAAKICNKITDEFGANLVADIEVPKSEWLTEIAASRIRKLKSEER